MPNNRLELPKILVLSAYDAASHQYWRTQLAAGLPEYQWTQLALPPRHFSWRLRGNSFTWSSSDYNELDRTYDLIIATSNTDITALRGFRPNLGRSPLIVYFHENQFSYPASKTKHSLVEIQLTSVYNAWCADKVVFNSHYNKETFITGAAKLLKKLPDGIPKNTIKQIEQKTRVIPVGIGNIEGSQNTVPALSYSPKKHLHLLWNHRWEYDKNPKIFFDAVARLIEKNVPLRLSVVGQQFRHLPDAFVKAKENFANIIEHWGYQERKVYHDLLNQCNVVVSSADHDFQGLSIQEAISKGCVPVTPDRVAYQEYVPDELRYPINTKNETDALANLLYSLYQNGYQKSENPVSNYTWNKVTPAYRTLIEQLIR